MNDEKTFLPTDFTLAPWNGRAILLVDLDAFFASVEQLDHPHWRGKPVIVGGDATRRGVVSTCSYEARAFGVRSAMPSVTAARLCPDAIWTTGHFDRYNEMSAKVMSILLDESPLLQQVSIDEAFLDVTPGRYSKEHPVHIAQRIQRRVAELGVTCSVGVGSSKTIAKIASDIDKPSGITVVFPGSEQNFLAPLPIRKMSGIGIQTAKKLEGAGIHTLGDIAACDPKTVSSFFGVNTIKMCERCKGIDNAPIELEREAKSVSSEITFERDLDTEESIRTAIAIIASKVGRRLRREQHTGRTVVLKMRYDDLSIRTARQALDFATDQESDFIPHLNKLIATLWKPGIKVRLIGVGITGFKTPSEQMQLFEKLEDHEETAGDTSAQTKNNAAKYQLSQATDAVKDKFGPKAVRFGSELLIGGHEMSERNNARKNEQ